MIDNSPVSATLKIETDLELPVECALEPSARSKETVRCPVATSLTVWAGVARIDIETAFENRAKDHRLRVLFPTGIESDLSWAEGQFDVIGRPVRLRAIGTTRRRPTLSSDGSTYTMGRGVCASSTRGCRNMSCARMRPGQWR